MRELSQKPLKGPQKALEQALKQALEKAQQTGPEKAPEKALKIKSWPWSLKGPQNASSEKALEKL